MKIVIEKSSGKSKCRGPKCKKNPEYINPADNHIIAGVKLAKFTLKSPGGTNSSFYCCDCIDVLYEEMKSKLNRKLWIYE